MPAVNSRRGYNSAGRREQASANRRAVLDAAQEAFLAHGYTGVSIPDIAAAAGVSAEFVYKAFGAKPVLLKHVFDRSLVGDDEPVPMQERPDIRRLKALTDTAAILDGYAEHLGRVQSRGAPVYLLARDAAAADPAAAPIVEQMNAERLSGMTAMATQLLGLGQLRPGLKRAEVRDILWTVNAPELYDLLVLRRGWAVARYVDFVRSSLKTLLLP